jgi:hypothetical protein
MIRTLINGCVCSVEMAQRIVQEVRFVSEKRHGGRRCGNQELGVVKILIKKLYMKDTVSNYPTLRDSLTAPKGDRYKPDVHDQGKISQCEQQRDSSGFFLVVRTIRSSVTLTFY